METVKPIMTNEEIKVEMRSSYGVERIYPACELSKQLIKLTGRKTWDKEHLRVLESLGLQIKFVTNYSL